MERLTLVRRALALLAVGSFVLLGCGDDDVAVGTEGTTTTTTALPTGGSEQERLDAARARWDAAGIADYTWSYRRSCFCPPFAVTVVVEDGAAVSHEVEADPAVDPVVPEEVAIFTVEDLFAEVQQAIDTADSVTVEYEDETGRVLTVDVDQITNAVDDEYSYAVTAFAEPGDSPPTTEAPVTDRVELSEHFGCGHGFHASNPEQTVALRIDVAELTPTAFPAVIQLPDPGWVAAVHLGEELYANWCNDVIDSSQPQPRIDESWTIVAGTMEFVGEPPNADTTSGIRSVTVRLTGLVAERPDGSRVELRDLEVTNDSWGMFAG